MNTIIFAILNALAPHIVELIGAVLTLLIGLIAARISRWTGIQIEARHREALHSALMTGVRVALDRGLPRQQAVDLAVGYARSSVPDAMRRLAPAPEVLNNLARAKLAEVRPEVRPER